ncbi:hypothetical protein LZ31DRAFT_144964 [Colletotrichum somersetense]|nr:hypothetical protein LZ31DRAFT_144964 [Colletotrichum somersetense]
MTASMRTTRAIPCSAPELRRERRQPTGPVCVRSYSEVRLIKRTRLDTKPLENRCVKNAILVLKGNLPDGCDLEDIYFVDQQQCGEDGHKNGLEEGPIVPGVSSRRRMQDDPAKKVAFGSMLRKIVYVAKGRWVAALTKEDGSHYRRRAFSREPRGAQSELLLS